MKPDYYTPGDRDIIALSLDYQLGPMELNIIKYLYRASKKSPDATSDIAKAQEYIARWQTWLGNPTNLLRHRAIALTRTATDWLTDKQSFYYALASQGTGDRTNAIKAVFDAGRSHDPLWHLETAEMYISKMEIGE